MDFSLSGVTNLQSAYRLDRQGFLYTLQLLCGNAKTGVPKTDDRKA